MLLYKIIGTNKLYKIFINNKIDKNKSIFCYITTLEKQLILYILLVIISIIKTNS